jgi:hypothetical protein
MTNSSPGDHQERRRSGRFCARPLVGGTLPIEDITAIDLLSSLVGTSVGINIPGIVDYSSQPTMGQCNVRGRSRSKKNGNWTDEQFSSAISAYDNGMSMKKASEQFHISYSSL